MGQSMPMNVWAMTKWFTMLRLSFANRGLSLLNSKVKGLGSKTVKPKKPMFLVISGNPKRTRDWRVKPALMTTLIWNSSAIWTAATEKISTKRTLGLYFYTDYLNPCNQGS